MLHHKEINIAFPHALPCSPIASSNASITLANAPLLTALIRGQSSIYLYILILSYIIYKII